MRPFALAEQSSPASLVWQTEYCQFPVAHLSREALRFIIVRVRQTAQEEEREDVVLALGGTYPRKRFSLCHLMNSTDGRSNTEAGRTCRLFPRRA